MLATMQMRLPGCISFAPSRTLRNEPMTLMSNRRRNCSTVVSRNGTVSMTPAAVTSASRPPNASRTFANAATVDASSATSISTAVPRLPAVVLAPSRLRSRQATRHPSAVSFRAVAAPMPLAAPVTATRRPRTVSVMSLQC